MLVLLLGADQTALPIRSQEWQSVENRESAAAPPCKAIRPSVAGWLPFPSVGNGEPIGRVAHQDLLFPREPRRLDNGNQSINLLVVLLPVGSA